MSRDARNLSAENNHPRPKAWFDRMAAGAARDRFGTVHLAGSPLSRGACYYPPMAFGRKTKTAAPAAPAKPARARRSKPKPPPAPELEPAPTLTDPDDTESTPNRWAPSHDEEW